ncbi:sdr family [Fusarium tjaetaba]|uniref:Sdr family n=1 Tax=Fusarium tjaetaba TaxID=1567544 RepID=A0A8H5SGV2_9HYPO|nr:sdr family [Fusarium tjaetaba]KAF5651373.1 sdr family [Fusarium tjaetaba]
MSFAFGSVPSQKGAKTAKPGTWDKPLPTDPIRERIDNGSWEEYKAFPCHPDYRSFSLEEHRLEDYEHDKGRNAAHNANPNAQSIFATGSKPLIKETLVDKGKIQLLQGSGVEIQVGTTTPFSNCDETKSFKTWCLPINLVSHYSPYLKETYSLSLQQSDKRIRLHGYPPEVFGLFVEWMYYGSYESPSVVSIYNADAKCWVLGDKLRSIEFQNCAMRRLHEHHTRPTFGRPMTSDDVRYVFSNTSPGSQLRSFYMHFVVEHFGSPDKLLGTSSDWDTLLQSQPEIRILLLKKFRESIFLKSHVESIDKYLKPNKRSILALRQKKGTVELATGAESAKAAIFNFDEKSDGKSNSPQQREAFQLVSTTKNYEGAALKFGWKLGESAENPSKPIFKTIQPNQDPISELDAEPALGRASKCSTSVGKSDDVSKAPETEKGKEPRTGECLDNKKSEVGEASTLLG